MLVLGNATISPYFLPVPYGNQEFFSWENSVSNACIFNGHMLYETDASLASAQVYAVWIGLRQVSGAYIVPQNFLENK